MSFIRTPFTDAFSSFENFEAVKRCREFNMQLALCKEAYGLHRAEKLCKDEYDDFKECVYGFKQARQLIQEERKKLYKKGELKEQYAEPPPLDSLNNRTNPI
ncbi:unnamed protein product [Ixodes hexagonus]